MSPSDLMDQFVLRLIASHQKENVLHLYSFSPDKRFVEPVFHSAGECVHADIGDKIKGSYDLILGDISPALGGPTPIIPGNWDMIAKHSKHLSDNGIGFFTIEPKGFSGSKGERFLSELEESGLFVNAYLEAPKGVWSQTSITPTIAFISRQRRTFFVGEMSSEGEIIQILENIKQSDFSNVVETAIERRAFVSFEVVCTPRVPHLF